MRVVRAKLIKRVSDDGLVEVADNVALGKEYEVDVDSRQVFDCFNLEHQKRHTKEMVMAVPRALGVPSEWLPTEMLEIPVDA